MLKTLPLFWHSGKEVIKIDLDNNKNVGQYAGQSIYVYSSK